MFLTNLNIVNAIMYKYIFNACLLTLIRSRFDVVILSMMTKSFMSSNLQHTNNLNTFQICFNKVIMKEDYFSNL